MSAPEYDIEVSRVVDAPRDRVYEALTDPDQFARWYGPDGFPVTRDTVALDPRVGGRQRFTMVAEFDPQFRTTFDGHFTEVVPSELLGEYRGVGRDPRSGRPWASNLRIELLDEDGKTRIVVREGPHPPGTTEMGRQSWEMMLPKLESLVRE